MAAYQKVKDKVLKANAELDEKADSLLDKAKAPSWTGLVLFGAALGLAFITLMLTISLLLK